MVASIAARRRVIEVAVAPDEPSRLEMIARSRTEAASRLERARILLAYRAVAGARVTRIWPLKPLCGSATVSRFFDSGY
jgi:hypothetical protein